MDMEPVMSSESNGHAVLPEAAENGAHRNGAASVAGPQAALEPLMAVVESLLFAAGAPVTLGRLVEALDGPGRAEVLRALEILAATYEGEGRGVRLVQVAGGYQLRTVATHAPWVRRLLQERPPRLSRPMLETLAIVAYRQPCTRIEIEAIRGVDADAVLSTLTERRLVRILGRKEAPGRPLLYGTTREFLEVFGLPDLSALPTLRELGNDAEILAAVDLTVGPGGVTPSPPAEGE
jgi:segregation and condensation protein B